jgi:hypothetical protein
MGIHADAMRTPYTGGEGGSFAKALSEKKERVSELKRKTETIERPAVLINAVS